MTNERPASLLRPMLEAEAIRLREILLAREGVSPLLDLRSSTRHFRERDKPHIERELFAPLAAAGIDVFHSDLKHGEGIDLAGDVTDSTVRDVLKTYGFRAILVANVLEHVCHRAAVAAACEEILGEGGLILVTVPSSFPYHADPIDTGYRPTPAALAAAFTRSRPLLLEEVTGRTYEEEMRARGWGFWRELGRTLLLAPICFARPKSFRARLDRWLWYRRRYRVSVALVEVASLDG